LDRVAIISGKYKVPRKVLTNSKGNPYRVPRLVDHQGDLAKPWFIVFYVWDIGLKKLVRKRMGKDELNANNVKARRARAFEMIAQLTDELKNGGQVESQTKAKEVVATNNCTNMNWGELIRRIREQKELTQQNLADELKVHKSTVIRWEQKGKIKAPMLEKIADAFSMKLADLYSYHSNPTLIEDPISYYGKGKSKVSIVVELDGSLGTLDEWLTMLKRINNAISI